jgi:hypothetical protein
VNRVSCDLGKEAATHLRLVLSASELALIPFELSVAPAGFPGAGQPLLLQSQMPLCITRETRRVPEEFVEWPDRPRVLFVYASPPGFPEVPYAAHLLALRQSMAPWIGSTTTDDPEARQKRVAPHLAVLPDASVNAIEDACRNNEFTHIHILAHGHERHDGPDVRFGLALHDPATPHGEADIVSGERLSTALRVSNRKEHGKPSRPAVVTLASCNSGNVGTVVGAGASVAHALHEAGIPMVIASQFPLSFGGSIRLVEALYEGLLWGEDPRKLVIDLRRRLYTQFPGTHDWASITVYASLPPGFEKQLVTVQIRRAQASIDEALKMAAEVTRRISSRMNLNPTQATAGIDQESENQALIEDTRRQIAIAKEPLEKLLTRYPSQQARIRGLLASTEKREAEIHYARRIKSKLTAAQRDQASQDEFDALYKARDYYWDAFMANRLDYWFVVQYLSLTLILQLSGRSPAAGDKPGESLAKLWDMTETQSLSDLQSKDAMVRVWALGNLVELYVLAPLIGDIAARHSPAEWAGKASTSARELVQASGDDVFGIFSTRRQVARYLEWYSDFTNRAIGQVSTIAEAAFYVLPETKEPEWQP